MLAVAIALLVLSALVAAANLGGALAALRRRRRGEPGGWSSVPLFSLGFAAGAFALAPDALGPWAFLPAALDPGRIAPPPARRKGRGRRTPAPDKPRGFTIPQIRSRSRRAAWG